MMTPSGPKWIAPFFYTAVTAALAALVLTAYLHGGHDAQVSEHVIADITIDRNGQPVREHCTTCHVNGGRPDSESMTRTVRDHPDIAPHRIEDLGCTGCHLGEGMALDLVISHGLPGLGERHVLAGRDVQASCFSCHAPSDLSGAEDAWAGFRLFYRMACNTCHTLGRGPGGGVYGPSLDRIGSVLGLDAIQKAIWEPRAEPANSIMPRFPLSSRQSRQLAIFLKSRKGTSPYSPPGTMERTIEHAVTAFAETPEGLKTAGEQQLFALQCLACHQYGAIDGRIAPDLTFIGALRDKTYLAGFLDNPTAFIPGSAMPRIPMAAASSSRLLAFLADEAASLRRLAASAHAGHGPANVAVDQNLSAKTHYMTLCQRCHAAGGDGLGPIQPNLSGLPRVFTQNAEFFRAVSDERLKDTLMKGVPGTSMPGYGRLLDETQREALLDLVFDAFIGIDRLDKVAPEVLPTRPDELPGPELAAQLYAGNCRHCHGVAGTGRGPEAMKFLPRPRNLKNQPYFSAVTDERIVRTIHDGVQGTAMPAFKDHLNSREIWALAGQVRSFSRTGE